LSLLARGSFRHCQNLRTFNGVDVDDADDDGNDGKEGEDADASFNVKEDKLTDNTSRNIQETFMMIFGAARNGRCCSNEDCFCNCHASPLSFSLSLFYLFKLSSSLSMYYYLNQFYRSIQGLTDTTDLCRFFLNTKYNVMGEKSDPNRRYVIGGD